MKIEIENLELNFKNKKALDGITIWEMRGGNMYFFIGPNGSGKTSLLKCISGHKLEQAKLTGKLCIDGVDVTEFWSWQIADSVRYCPQEPIIINGLTALENIVVGHESNKMKIFWNKHKDYSNVQNLMKETGLMLQLEDNSSNFNASVKQKINILRALYKLKSNSFLLLDEPTTLLTKTEIESLFNYLDKISSRDNIGIILVTHLFSYIDKFADKIIQFNNGHIEGNFTINDLKNEKIDILRETRVTETFETSSLTSEIILEGNLSTTFQELEYNLKFEIKKGSIVIIGATKIDIINEFFNYLSGLNTLIKWHGIIKYNGNLINNDTIYSRRDMGIGFIPADKVKRGLFVDLSIYENLIINKNKKPVLIFNNKSEEFVHSSIKRMNYQIQKTNELAYTLSGGFKQRLILTREWIQSPKLLIVHNPTQGLDPESRKALIDDFKTFIENEGSLIILGELDGVTELKGVERINFENTTKSRLDFV